MHQEKLKKHFGFDNFRGGQEEVITNLLNRQSAAAIFPTGAGKSLCYQLPALYLPHLTIVISPLLALIQDQLAFLEKMNIPATRIDSTLKKEELQSIQKELQQEKYKILMISVERFKNEHFRSFISKIPISLLVIDEAHCISEWGHNFRPDYLKLPQYARDFNIPQTLLLTATATPQVVSDMCKKFNIPKQHIVVTGFYRPNLHLSVIPAKQDQKLSYLKHYLTKLSTPEPTIIYVTLQKTAVTLANHLLQLGIEAVAYHAGIKNEDRERIQHDFMSGKSNCIVATIAFGMGIDKSNIRSVIHYDLPKSLENYSQEIGRAGRDGNTADCVALVNMEGITTLENFIYGDTPEQESISDVVNTILQSQDQWETNLITLSNRCNIRQLPLKTLLVYLEMEKVITPLYSYYASYKIKTVLPEEEIIAKFKNERQQFIKAIFNNSSKARLWTTIKFEEIIKNYPTDRARITSALEYFNDKGYIVLEAKEMKEVYSVNKTSKTEQEIKNLLINKFQQKEVSEVNRIEKMISFFESSECYTKQLSTYFGERHEWQNCGHCSVCKTGSVVIPKPDTSQDMRTLNYKELTHDLNKKATAKQLTVDTISRFLCGINAPILSKIKAKQLPNFASLENYRYQKIREWVSAHLTQKQETTN